MIAAMNNIHVTGNKALPQEQGQNIFFSYGIGLT